MRRRLVVVTLLALSMVLGSLTPARSQGVFYEIGVARGAFAFWEDQRAHVFAFAFAGQGVLYNADVGEPLVGDVGCAGIGNEERGVFGCGELSEFSIDDDLGAANGKGSFDGTIFEFESGKSKPGGKISFEADWKATGDPAPRYDQGSHVEPSFAGVFIEPDVVARDASDGVKGKVTSSSVGPGPTRVVEAATFFGGLLAVELHG